MTYLWPKFCKQEWTIQMPSFYTVCGLEQGVGSGPELKSMWPRFGPVLVYLVYSWLTLGLASACLWPKSGKQERITQVPSFHAVCGPDESVRCGPDLGLRNFAIWVKHSNTYSKEQYSECQLPALMQRSTTQKTCPPDPGLESHTGHVKLGSADHRKRLLTPVRSPSLQRYFSNFGTGQQFSHCPG